MLLTQAVAWASPFNAPTSSGVSFAASANAFSELLRAFCAVLS
jgi:hypothetical protein